MTMAVYYYYYYLLRRGGMRKTTILFIFYFGCLRPSSRVKKKNILNYNKICTGEHIK